MDDALRETFSCPNNFNMVITGMEKSKVYKLRMAAYTSKGSGNFSEYFTVITNIDGRLFSRGRLLGTRLLPMHCHRFDINVLCRGDILIECGGIIKNTGSDYSMLMFRVVQFSSLCMRQCVMSNPPSMMNWLNEPKCSL